MVVVSALTAPSPLALAPGRAPRSRLGLARSLHATVMSCDTSESDEGFERLLRLAQVGLSSRAEAWPALLGVPALRQTEPAEILAAARVFEPLRRVG